MIRAKGSQLTQLVCAKEPPLKAVVVVVALVAGAAIGFFLGAYIHDASRSEAPASKKVSDIAKDPAKEVEKAKDSTIKAAKQPGKRQLWAAYGALIGGVTCLGLALIATRKRKKEGKDS